MFFKKSQSGASSSGEQGDDAGNNAHPLVRQDPHLRVSTRYGENRTTRSSEHSSTTIDSATNRITLETQRQTVDHRQVLGVATWSTEYRPTQEELNQMLPTNFGKVAQLRNTFSSGSTNARLPSQTISSTLTERTERRNESKVTVTQEVSQFQLRGRPTSSNVFQTDARPSGSSPMKSTTGYGAAVGPRTPSRVSSELGSSYTPVYRKSNSQPTYTAVTSPQRPSDYSPTNKLSSVSKSPTLPPSGGDKPKTKLKPGLVYIVNMKDFGSDKKKMRVGSEKDVDQLKDTFKEYKLEIDTKQNLSVSGVKNLVDKIRRKDFANRSCLVVVIMSHGSQNENLAAVDGTFSLDNDVIQPILHNESLKQKAKIFIVQACKGQMAMQTDAQPFGGSPAELLKCYSTYEGYVSYRTEEGSIFIKAFCKNLKKYGREKHIEDIMKIVIKEVQKEVNQVPSYTSTLSQPFVFGAYA